MVGENQCWKNRISSLTCIFERKIVGSRYEQQGQRKLNLGGTEWSFRPKATRDRNGLSMEKSRRMYHYVRCKNDSPKFC